MKASHADSKKSMTSDAQKYISVDLQYMYLDTKVTSYSAGIIGSFLDIILLPHMSQYQETGMLFCLSYDMSYYDYRNCNLFQYLLCKMNYLVQHTEDIVSQM